MIADLKPYPEYKDSGEEWLGKVPKHWEMRRTKTILNERVEKGFPDEPLLAATQTKGVVRKEQYENRTVLALKDLHLLKLVKVGDFVISLRSFQGGIEYAREQGIISPAYTVIYPAQSKVQGYLRHLFKSKPYIENLTLHVTGIRQGQNIDYNKLSRSVLPFPSLSEQTAIARFLDFADRRIRRSILAKQKLIKLLEEEKQAVIHHAVTRGLDPDVRLKPSGVEWLGEVPEHWEEIRLKFLVRRITDGEHISPLLVDKGIPLLSAKDVRNRTILYEVDKYVSPEHAEQFWQRCRPERGDFLIVSRGATIGRVALVTKDTPFCLMGSVILCKSKGDYSAEFIYYALNAYHAQISLWFTSASSAQQAIYIQDVAELRLPIPPSSERENIVQSLDESLGRIGNTIIRAKREITLLREYRTRLIADIVTGKLDVREATARLPDKNETEEIPIEDPEIEEETPVNCECDAEVED